MSNISQKITLESYNKKKKLNELKYELCLLLFTPKKVITSEFNRTL